MSVTHPEDRERDRAEFVRFLKGDSSDYRIEKRILQDDGSYRHFLAHGQILDADADGRVRRVLGTHTDITDLKRIEEQVELAVVAGRQGVWEWLPETDDLHPLSNWLELTGYEAGELPSMAACYEHGVIPLDDHKLVVSELEALVYGERDQAEIEFRIVRKSGLPFWSLTRFVVAARDADGRAQRIVGVNIDITERRATEQRLNIALGAARQGTWEWVIDDDRFTPDARWNELFGAERDAVETMSDVVRYVIHPDDQALAWRIVAGSKTLESDYAEAEFRMRSTDGTYLWVLTRSLVTARDDEFNPTRIVGTMIDISRVKEAQDKHQAARELLRAVLDAVPESIFWKDAESRYLGANRRFVTYAGFKEPEDIVGLTDADMVWGDHAAFLFAEEAAILNGEVSCVDVERQVATATNENLWVQTTKVPLFNSAGEAIGTLGADRDFTAYHHALEDLQVQRDRLELIIHGTGVGIWEFDYGSDRVLLNARAAELFGYTLRELEPFTLSALLAMLHPDDQSAFHVAVEHATGHEEGRFECDFRARHKLGHWVWIHDTGRITARDAKGNPLRASGALIDISERMERDGHLKTIATAVTRAHGSGLLQTVVRAASELCETRTAFVGALNEDGTTITIIAAWPPEAALEGLEYELEGSPCATTIIDDLCIFPDQVAQKFPLDLMLAEQGIESYAGRRLVDESGETSGVFVMFDYKPLEHLDRIRSVLDILASTAGNELDRERRTRILRDSETRYRQTYERMPILLCTINESDQVIDVNEAWCRTSGYTRKQCLGRKLPELFAEQSAAALAGVLAADDDADQAGHCHLGLRHADGRTITTSCTLFAGGFVGDNSYRIVALADVTAQLRAEEQLRIAATAFETHGAIVVTDADRKILQANEAFTELTQFGQLEAIGQVPEMLKSRRHNKNFYTQIWREVEQFGRWEGEMWGRRKNGSEFPVWQAITAVYDDHYQLTHYVINMLDITDRVRAEREIERLAFFDSLTGLANRRYLLDRLEAAIAAAKRRGSRGALLFIDLDHFKQINDSMGHSVGDAVLIQVGDRLQELVRKEDVVSRLGGDEFVVLLGEASDALNDARAHVRTVVEKIQVELSLPYLVDLQEFHITPTVGVAFFPDDAETPAELLKGADSAMYQGKTDGRNTWRFFDQSMATAANERMRLENDLRLALEQDQLLLHFQPQIRPGKGVIGAEALVRWQHPEFGFVPPDKFIPIAEDTALIHDIGAWIIQSALVTAAEWLSSGLDYIDHLAINLSARQFRASNFVDDLENMRARAGVPARFIVLELTERVVVEDIEGTIAKMLQLRALGFRFSVDDFGIGYSSLAYLRRLPLNQLKIDRSFVLDVVEDANAGVIAETIISMGRQLGLETIAEGIETEQQRDFLLARGCDEFQGYLYCKPLPDHEFRAFCVAHGNAMAVS